MKNSYLRAGAALACAAVLSACGGSDGELLLGGYVYGVTKAGLVLTNNGGSDYAVPAMASGSGEFYFPELIGTDDRYDVAVKESPSNTSGCTIENASGRAGYHVTTIYVTCTLKTHELAGSISNLQGTLVLVNGSDRKEIAAGATSFQMEKIAEDSPYGVSILTQPANQTCSISNGSGTMGTGNVSNIAITCTSNTPEHQA